MGYPQPLHQLMHAAFFIKTNPVITSSKIKKIQNLLHLMDHPKLLQKQAI
jgi:hypothetical protein